MKTYATAYAGHQFGNWAGQLGDGRAIYAGEIQNGNHQTEIQWKGAGATPYSELPTEEPFCVPRFGNI